MSKNYLTIVLDDKVYTQRKPNSKYIELDLKGNEIKRHNEIPSEINDIITLYKKIEENPKDYIWYEILDFNNTVKINKIFENPEVTTHFKIPDYIEGYPVSVISSNIFDEEVRLTIEQIDLPDSVEVLFPSAFANAINLKTFFMPESLRYLPEKCFSNCDRLKNIVLNNVKELRNATFEGCRSLKKIDLSNIKSIGNFCFASCTSLKEVIFSDKIHTLPIGSFYNCSSLKSIYIPDNITRICDNVFAFCNKLLNISINSKTDYDGDAFTYKQLLNLKTRKEKEEETIER